MALSADQPETMIRHLLPPPPPNRGPLINMTMIMMIRTVLSPAGPSARDNYKGMQCGPMDSTSRRRRHMRARYICARYRALAMQLRLGIQACYHCRTHCQKCRHATFGHRSGPQLLSGPSTCTVPCRSAFNDRNWVMTNWLTGCCCKGNNQWVPFGNGHSNMHRSLGWSTYSGSICIARWGWVRW